MQLRLETLTIVGVGLIGGAIGLAAKKRGVARHIVGVGRDPARLEVARRLGAIDAGTVQLAEGVRDASLVVFCTPVDRIAGQIKEAAAYARKPVVFTDAGSVKQSIVEAVASMRLGKARYVGAHPLAGSEKKGVEHAHADLFVDRVTVMTPTAKTTKSAQDTAGRFWHGLGCRVRVMTPEEHDRALAVTSHLPHLVASALAGLLPNIWDELAASGFRDTTRIAGGDPEVWTPIFQHNRGAVIAAMQQFGRRLRQFQRALREEDRDTIDKLLTKGKKVRDALGS